jgi:hypothetical protein
LALERSTRVTMCSIGARVLAAVRLRRCSGLRPTRILAAGAGVTSSETTLSSSNQPSKCSGPASSLVADPASGWLLSTEIRISIPVALRGRVDSPYRRAHLRTGASRLLSPGRPHKGRPPAGVAFTRGAQLFTQASPGSRSGLGSDHSRSCSRHASAAAGVRSVMIAAWGAKSAPALSS